jgi:hypothetical protein
MDIPNECKSLSNSRKIVIRDKGSKNPVCIVFMNKSSLNVDIIDVDDCVIKSGVRCDYLLILNDTEYYVELKGSDVSHAVKQIERTVKLLSKKPKTQPKHCFVISSRCPLSGTEIQEIQLKFKKHYNSSFRVKNTYYEYEI